MVGHDDTGLAKGHQWYTSLLKPRTPKPRRSVEEIYLPVCHSLTCSRVAGNANTVDRLKGSSSQYTSVHSDADWGNYSSSTYSLCAPVNRWLKTEHQRSNSSLLLLVVFGKTLEEQVTLDILTLSIALGKALQEQALDIFTFRLGSVMTINTAWWTNHRYIPATRMLKTFFFIDRSFTRE